MLVTLDTATVQAARELAVARRGAHQRSDQRNQRYSKDPFKEDTVGVLGEYAFASLTNGVCEVDQELYRGGDNGYDFEVLIAGVPVRIDVKLGQAETHNLLVRYGSKKKADVYVYGFVRGEGQVEFVGYITDEDARKVPTRIVNRRLGILNHVISPSRLKPIEEFVQEVLAKTE